MLPLKALIVRVGHRVLLLFQANQAAIILSKRFPGMYIPDQLIFLTTLDFI
jgi:hypothetical protein